jgi:hypothetical protein
MMRESHSQHGSIVVKVCQCAALGPVLVQVPQPDQAGLLIPETVNLDWFRTTRIVALVLVGWTGVQLPAMVNNEHTCLWEKHVNHLGQRRRPERRGIVPAVAGIIARE